MVHSATEGTLSHSAEAPIIACEARRVADSKMDEFDPKRRRMTDSQRSMAAIGLAGLAIIIHLFVCRWGTEAPGPQAARIVTLPNLARYVAQKGPRNLYVSAPATLGLLIGTVVGVALPAVMLAVAAFVRFKKDEFKQIVGAFVCILIGFVLIVVISWVSKYW